MVEGLALRKEHKAVENDSGDGGDGDGDGAGGAPSAEVHSF